MGRTSGPPETCLLFLLFFAIQRVFLLLIDLTNKVSTCYCAGVSTPVNRTAAPSLVV